MAGSKGKFEYVFVPAAISEPIEQRTMIYKDEDQKVSCITDMARAHFKKGSTGMTGEQNSAFLENVLSQAAEKNPELDISKIDPSILEQFSSMQMVDVVTLLTPQPGNTFMQVAMYCDDSGSYKKLPLNVRCCQLTELCGRPTNVFGDAFLARSIDDGNERFERLDFVQAEFSPKADWIVLAQKKANKLQKDELKTDPAKGVPKQTMAPRKPPSDAQIATWKKQMDGWVDGKLKQYDEDEAFRTQRLKTFPSRREYEASLRNKAAEKIAAKVGKAPGTF
jgi:hypothetical protein